MDIVWQPQPGPQTEFCMRWEPEVLYGGAAGGGKTDCLIGEALRYVHKPKYHALILRRTFPQLQEIIDRTRIYYTPLGGVYKSGEHRWIFPSGARITLSHMHLESDKYNYQGKEFQYIGFDEVTQFTQGQYLYLFSRCRSTDPEIPKRIRATSNPGGPGHYFIKNRFQIGITEPKTTIHDKAKDTYRIFIPAKLKDNPILMKNDPDYVKMLMELPELERMRLMEGIWDAFEGQAIPELNYEVHGIADFDIPAEWIRYRTFDWGYSTPFSIGWWAVDFDGRLFRYREWYGAKEGDEINKGLRMSPGEVARGIKEREKVENARGIKINPGPADPDIWNPRWKAIGKNNFGIVGDSIATDMAAEGIKWIKADNDTRLGRQQFHKRLELDEDGVPQIKIFNSCKDFWRTVPLLREKETNPEEIENKDTEDHIYDDCRYFVMFKPVKPLPQKRKDIGSFQYERRKLIRARELAARTGMSLTQAYGRVRG